MSVDFEQRVRMPYNFNVHSDFSEGNPRDKDTIEREQIVTLYQEEVLQYCHEHYKPELLGAEQRNGVNSPLPKRDIVCVSQDHKKPGHLVFVSAILEVGLESTCHYTQPSNKAMVFLKDVMMIANTGVSYRNTPTNKS